MILCCKTCGNCIKSEDLENSCNYCGNQLDILIRNDELSQIDEKDLPQVITTLSEKYKTNNPEYNEDLWKMRSERDEINHVNASKNDLLYRTKIHMLTTGYNFEGYKIKSYLGVISSETVLGTGFLSEFSASFADFFGTQSKMFENKLDSAKQVTMDKLIKKSSILGGNAIIGVDIDYIMFSNNIIGVIANGTSVVIEEESLFLE